MNQKLHTIMKWAVSFDPRTKAGTHDSKPQSSVSVTQKKEQEEIEKPN